MFAAMMDTLPGGQTVAAVPSAAVVGGDAVRYAEADKAVLEASGDVGKLTKILRAHPILGCTTVMDIALKRSGFKPLDPPANGNFTAYTKYVDSLVSAPFFHLEYADTKELHERESNWDNLINSIAGLFDAVTSEDKSRIVDGLKQLAHSATSTSDKEERLNVFSQAAIAQNTTGIRVSIHHSSVVMIEHDGKHTTKQADYVVNRACLNFRLEEWPLFAGKVAAIQVTRVDDWLNANNSA